MKHIILSAIFAFALFAIPANAHIQNEDTKTETRNKIITLSAKDYEKKISQGVVLVDYWATWCGPCKKMEPILKEIAAETNIKVAKLNVDDYKAFVAMQKVVNIPTMIVYKDGVEVERLTGVYSKDELLEALNPYLMEKGKEE